MSGYWGWTQREDGLCERNGCGRPSWSWRDESTPAKATRTVMLVPHEGAHYSRLTPEAFFACGTHGGVMKRKSERSYRIIVLDEVVADRAATLAQNVAETKRLWAESRAERERYVRDNRGRYVEEFLADDTHENGASYAKLDEPDEYGRRYINVKSTYYTKLTPAQAEALAGRLLELAGEARDSAKGA